jgi:hypothetical protein
MAAVVELDYRSNGNLDVTLFWDPEDGSVVVQVVDWATQEDFSLSVDPAKALDAFTHPFAYAEGASGLDELAPRPVPVGAPGSRRPR